MQSMMEIVFVVSILLLSYFPVVSPQQYQSLSTQASPVSSDGKTSVEYPNSATTPSSYSALNFKDQKSLISPGVSSPRQLQNVIGSCSEKEYYEWYYEQYPLNCRYLIGNQTFDEQKYLIYCDKECGTPYLQFLRSCGSDVAADYYKNLCHENSNGIPCAYFFLAAAYLQPAYHVEENCKLSFENTTSSCSFECFVSLYQFKIQIGCCVNNIYNHSTAIQSNFVAYSLWSKCGVATPGYCSGNKGLTISLPIISAFFVLNTMLSVYT